MFSKIFRKRKDEYTTPYAELAHHDEKNPGSVESMIQNTMHPIEELLTKPPLVNPSPSEDFNKEDYIHASDTQLKNRQERIHIANTAVKKIIDNHKENIPKPIITRTENLFEKLNATTSQAGTDIRKCLEQSRTIEDTKTRYEQFLACYEASVYMTAKMHREVKTYLETGFSYGKNSLKDEMLPILQEQKESKKDT